MSRWTSAQLAAALLVLAGSAAAQESTTQSKKALQQAGQKSATQTTDSVQDEDGDKDEKPKELTEADRVNSIRRLLTKGDLKAARAEYDAAVEAHPDSVNLGNLLYQFYYQSYRKGNSRQATAYLKELVEDRSRHLDKPQVAAQMTQYVLTYLSLASRTGQTKQATEKAEQIAEQLQQSESSVSFATAARIHERLALMAAADVSQAAAARKRLEKTLSAFDERFTATPEKGSDGLLRYQLLRSLAIIAQRSGDTDADDLNKMHETYIEQLWSDHQSDTGVASMYLNSKLSGISRNARREPFESKKKLEALQELVSTLKEEEKISTSVTRNFDRSVASVSRTIEAAIKHAELIGTQAIPIEVNAWVNGSPLAPADLEGKVVLLDFWAVWCGPCIATFPHLREWHDKYSDKGLVIVGLTTYYGYRWDEEANKAVRSRGEEVPEDDEHTALEGFAGIHDLKHRFAVALKDDRHIQEHYGVTGIPQAVVIDQEGKVRLIRVGSGSANAHDIDTLLESLLGDAEKAGE